MDGTEKSMSITYLDGDRLSSEEMNKTGLFRTTSDDELEQTKRNEQRQHAIAAAAQESSPIFYYIHIALFAMCGCLCRIFSDILFGTITKIESFGGIINQSFMANMFACFILGILNSFPIKRTKLVALYEGISVGFCGTLSTWSVWNQQLSQILIEETAILAQPQVFTILGWWIGLLVFFATFRFGQDVGRAIKQKIKAKIIRKARMIAHVTATIIFVITFAISCLVLLLDIPEKEKSAFLAVLISPFGACLRYKISKIQIDKGRLPLGTLIVNISGSAIVALLHVVVTRLIPYQCAGTEICWTSVLVYAAAVGFCGSFTTIANVVSEFYFIKRNYPTHAYVYVIITVAVIQIVTGVINVMNHYIK